MERRRGRQNNGTLLTIGPKRSQIAAMFEGRRSCAIKYRGRAQVFHVTHARMERRNPAHLRGVPRKVARVIANCIVSLSVSDGALSIARRAEMIRAEPF
jgi:hypothetical protein